MQFEKYFYGGREIVAFVDEAGDPTLRDPGNPLFVLGACVVEGEKVGTDVRAPWLELRKAVLGDEKQRLHMRKIGRRLRQGQINAMISFFQKASFKRVSIAVTDRTLFKIGDLPREPTLEIALSLLLSYIADVSGGATPMEGLAIVFEDGPLLKRIRREWPRRRLTRNDGVKIPVSWAVLDKTADEPALEVADFIAHSTAGFIRSNRNPESKFAARFASVYPKESAHLHRGIELNKAEIVSDKP